mgnify:CR=1 FL=1
MWMMPAGFLFVGGERKGKRCSRAAPNPTPWIQRAKKREQREGGKREGKRKERGRKEEGKREEKVGF